MYKYLISLFFASSILAQPFRTVMVDTNLNITYPPLADFKATNGLGGYPISVSDTFYVELGGDDTTAIVGDPTHPWQTIAAASDATKGFRDSGDNDWFKIKIGAGDWDLDVNSITLTNKIVVEGSGRGITTILSAAQEHTDGNALMPDVNDYIMHLTITNDNAAAVDQTCIGIQRLGPNGDAGPGTNWVIDCELFDGAHGVQLNPSSADGHWIIVENCYINDGNCPVQVLGTNNFLEVYNNILYGIGPEPHMRSFTIAGGQNFGGTLTLKGNTIKCRPANGVTVGAILTDALPGSSIESGITNYCFDNVFDLSGSGITVLADYYLDKGSDASATFEGGNHSFDSGPLTSSVNGGSTLTHAASTVGNSESFNTLVVSNTASILTNTAAIGEDNVLKSFNTFYTNGNFDGLIKWGTSLTGAAAGIATVRLIVNGKTNDESSLGIVSTETRTLSSRVGPNQQYYLTNINTSTASATSLWTTIKTDN